MLPFFVCIALRTPNAYASFRRAGELEQQEQSNQVE